MDIEFQFQRGMDQSQIGPKADLSAPQLLTNFKQDPNTTGSLKQTDLWVEYLQLANGTYWTGSTSATDSTKTVMACIVANSQSTMYFLTRRCAYARTYSIFTLTWTVTQLPITQIVAHTANGAIGYNAMCRYDGTPTNLGDQLDVVIDGATTFKWRINAGAYTTLVPITTTGVAVTGGTLWFKVATGFTVGTLWSWQRTDTTYEGADSSYMPTRPIEWRKNKNHFFYLSQTGSLYELFTTYVSPVGYAGADGNMRTLASHFNIFENHIFLFGSMLAPSFLEFPGFGEGTVAAMTIRNGDNLDYHDFYPTDVNEADVYILGSGDCFLGSAVLNSRLYVMSTSRFYYSDYIGLPTPFAFKEFMPFAAATFRFGVSFSVLPEAMIPATTNAYLLTENGVWSFDGTSVKHISKPIDPVWEGNWLGAFGYYDATEREFIWYKSHSTVVISDLLNCYQERINGFYRWASRWPFCIFRLDTVGLSTGQPVGRVLQSRPYNYSGTAYIADDFAGTGFVTPVIRTQFVDAGIAGTAECTGTVLRARTQTVRGSEAVQGDSVILQLYWVTSDCGLNNDNTSTTSAVSTTDALAVFTSLLTRPPATPAVWRDSSYPHVAFKTLALELRAAPIGGLPQRNIVVYGMVLYSDIPEDVLHR